MKEQNITLRHIESGQILSGILRQEYVHNKGWTVLVQRIDGEPTVEHEIFALAKCWERH